MRLQVDKIVAPFIDTLVTKPLPFCASPAADVYLELEAARAEAATSLCRDALTIVESIEGAAAIDRAREALEPIRLRLAALYPHCAGILDPDVWPSRAEIH